MGKGIPSPVSKVNTSLKGNNLFEIKEQVRGQKECKKQQKAKSNLSNLSKGQEIGQL